MEGKTYNDWAKYHSELFGMSSPADFNSLLRWARFFQGQGFEPEQLFAASGAIAAQDKVPKWRSEHFDALKLKLHQSRTREAKEEASPQKYCVKCGGSGTVSVPNHEAITRHGKYYSQIVSCDCFRGDQWRSHGIETLSVYTATYPDWKSIVYEWRERDREYLSTQMENAKLDNLFGSIIAKVKGNK
jgi:hypothetical protein